MTSHRNGKRSVMISDTMMQQFTSDEIETTIAHEIGHHLHHDSRWGTLVRAMLIIIRIYLALIALYWLMGLVGIRSIADTAGIPLFTLLMLIIGLMLLPIQSGFSRWRERMADQYALKVTGKPQVFASNMIKFANQSFYEANPDWLTRLTLSHPSYKERITMAERYTEELETQDGRWRLS